MDNETQKVQNTGTSGGCPFINLEAEFSPYYSDELYEIYASLRGSHPVFYSEKTKAWVITGYENIVRILNDQERISVANTSDSITPLHTAAIDILKAGKFTPESIMHNCDTKRHGEVRGLVSRLLSPKAFTAMADDIRNLVNEALDAFDPRTEIDLVADFCYGLPARVIFRMLDVPAEDTDMVKGWSTSISRMNFNPATFDQQISGANDMVDNWRYCADMVADRLKQPRSDYASNLLVLRNGDDNILTLNEITTLVYSLLFAGHESTTSQLANTLHTLLAHRESWDAICKDPALIPNAIEEVFRYNGAVVNFRRRTKTEITIDGVSIPAKATLLLAFASANRDETVFQDPDKFDIQRKNARRHLTLSNGPHVCIGGPLARLEMKIAIEEFSKRFPNMRLKNGVQIEYGNSFVFKGARSIPAILG